MAKKNSKGTLGKIPECKFKKDDKVIHLDTKTKGKVYVTVWSKCGKRWFLSMVDEENNEYIGEEKDFKKI